MVRMDTRTHTHPGAGSANAKHDYARHRPEDTTLYQTIEQHARAFFDTIGEQGASLPAFVCDEFDAYLGSNVCAVTWPARPSPSSV